MTCSFKTVAPGQDLALIEYGAIEGLTVLMLHGGPGYYWTPAEIEFMAKALNTRYKVRLLAVLGRGCGINDCRSQSIDLLDDNLLKRAHDLKAFAAPDILLGHSTGAMIALTALAEGYIQPRHTILLSPYTAICGEQNYWLTVKAKKYPRAFRRFYDFVARHWLLYSGKMPKDFVDDLFVYWGKLFPHLPDDEAKIHANLEYLAFHMIGSVPTLGWEDGEPYTIYPMLMQNIQALDMRTKEILLRIGTINAHWWQSNFQDGYPFSTTLKEKNFGQNISILSGAKDEIAPPETILKLAELLQVKPNFAPEGFHLAETNMPGTLQQALLDHIGDVLFQIKTEG